MKPVWSGTLSFGLVSIPIKLFSAINPQVYGFRLLHELCNTPLSYEKWCPRCNIHVAWENTVKGLQQDNGSFFILTQEKLAELKPEKTDAIDIIQFVDRTQIKPHYFENHYYVAPAKKGERSFFIFVAALSESNKVAIGQFVMRDKEYVCSINSHNDGLMLNTLNYAYEIRNINEIEELKKIPTIKKDEIELAKKLINQLTKKTFKLEKFKDTFAEKLKKAIKEKKIKRKKPSASARPHSGVIKKKQEKENLISLLKKSLKKQPRQQRKTAHAKPKRK